VQAVRLEAIPLFAALSDAERERVASVANELDVPAGTVLTGEGDFGYVVFAIETGSAGVLQGDGTIATLGPGDAFGEIAVLYSGRRTATVVATSPMRVIAFFTPDVVRLDKDLPELGRALRASIEERLDRPAERSESAAPR
jgi:CRP/FNR family transcriptional regulator, cyclic AMP receptor protein